MNLALTDYHRVAVARCIAFVITGGIPRAQAQTSGGASSTGTGSSGNGASGTAGVGASGSASTGQGNGTTGTGQASSTTSGINAGQTNASAPGSAANGTSQSPASGMSPSPNASQTTTGSNNSSAMQTTSPAASNGDNTGRASGNLLPSAGGTAAQTYTVGQTIADALRSSSDLQIAARNVEIDRKRADEAAASGRPSLGTSASATRFDQSTRVRLGNGPAVEVLGSHTEQLSINLGERFDIAGQIRASSNQAFLQSTADQYTLDSIRNARILRAKTIYFNLLRAQHQVQVAQAALTTAQRQLQDAQNLNAGQVGQKIDVYRAATQVATDQQQVTAAVNNEQIAEQNFNDLVGQPLSAPARVEDVPGVTVGTAIVDTTAVGANTTLSFTPFTVPQSQLAAIDVNQSLDTAFAARPELLVDQVNVRVSQTGITLARAGLEPSLSLNASGNYFPTTSFQAPRKRTAAITATLNIPLYDGGATRDRVTEARLRMENAQTILDSDKSSVALDVRQSYLNLLTAARQIDAANTALQQAVAARQLAQIRYEGQVGLYLEVTDAQAALVQAENSQVNAVYDYLVARAQFENAIGKPQTQ